MPEAVAPRADAGLRYDVEGAVATIALDEPDTRNALTNELLDALVRAFAEADADDRVRCIVLTSTHDKVFSAGGNLGGFSSDAPLVDRHLATERFPRLFRLVSGLRTPTICAANGHVLAGALGLMLACDLVIAKDTATFGTPEISVGAFPFIVMALVYRNVGRKKATELLLLGNRISAHDAERIGLVNRVVPAAGFDAVVDEWAAQLARRSPLVMRLGKTAIARQHEMGLDEALDFLHHNLTLGAATEDVQEGVKAFFEKREPVWVGR